MRLAAQEKSDAQTEMLGLRTRLYGLTQQGQMNADVDAAYWMLDRALAGKADTVAAIRYARETLATMVPEERPKVELKTRTLTKAEHDALLDGPAPRTVDADQYRRMMEEAQR